MLILLCFLSNLISLSVLFSLLYSLSLLSLSLTHTLMPSLSHQFTLYLSLSRSFTLSLTLSHSLSSTHKFLSDPDGYWIEVIRRSEKAKITNKYNFAQTMFRVKDPQKSLKFYTEILGMTLLSETHHSDFSLYFLAYASQNKMISEGIESGIMPDPKSIESKEFMKNMFGPVIELTHNHGTENDENFKYVIRTIGLQ